jgi:hypothetical protein
MTSFLNSFLTRFAKFLLPLYSLDQLAKKQHRPSFPGPLQAVLVDSGSYLLELVRYIHLNPIRANMVNGPDEYPWTSGH